LRLVAAAAKPAAVATPAATATAAAAATVAAATAAVLAGLGFVDGEGATAAFLAVRAAIAAWASASLLISTKPKPLLRPVSRSAMISALSTVPWALKSPSSAELSTS
jgi:hypothetical protein